MKMDGKISTLMNMNSEHQGYLKNLIAPGNDPSKKKILLCPVCLGNFSENSQKNFQNSLNLSPFLHKIPYKFPILKLLSRAL